MKGHRSKARILTYILLIIVLAHTALIALWAGPNYPMKQAIGSSTIRSYVNPIFQQDWQIFAPTPKRVSSEMDFRAQIRDAETGEIFATPWHALVTAEDEMIRHNPSPPRTAFAARRTSLTLHNVAADMNEDQREASQQSFHQPDTPPLAKVLQEATTDSGASNSQINTYLKYDKMATSLATLSAAVLYEGEIIGVQYRTAKRAVPDFEQRAHRTLADVTKAKQNFGWRQPASVTDAEVAYFAPYARDVPVAAEQNS